MKKVLITGANSYVGTNVEKWLLKEPFKYYIETLDMRDSNWKNFDFTKFDVVFHVAGIAHVSTKKSMRDLYFKVNKDLTIETAKKAKSSGVKQFIFMSSMIVYNSRETKITLSTKPNPDNFYGISKLQAEEGIQELQSDDFKICILRPPMIYGFNSVGNFSRLVKIANMLFIFPKYKNLRSFLYIDNLARYVEFYISNQSTGIFFPQNDERCSTLDIVIAVHTFKNRKAFYFTLMNPLIHFLVKYTKYFNKIFGDYYYDIPSEGIKGVTNLLDSIMHSIKKVQDNE